MPPNDPPPGLRSSAEDHASGRSAAVAVGMVATIRGIVDRFFGPQPPARTAPSAPSEAAAHPEVVNTVEVLDPDRGTNTFAEVNLTVRIPTQATIGTATEIATISAHASPASSEPTEIPPRDQHDSGPSAELLVMLFNRYDELARNDLGEASGQDTDVEIWLDLVAGPAAQYVDLARSSVSMLTIGLVNGRTIRRSSSATWEIYDPAEDSSDEIRIDLFHLGDI